MYKHSFTHVFIKDKSKCRFFHLFLSALQLLRKTINLHSLFIRCSEVKGLVWVVNKGQLLSMCADDCIYLLDIRGREIEVVQFIQFQKEKLTALNLAVNSNWVFVGTDKGNTHVVRLGKMA